jgi:hypothetical protein
MKSAYRTAFARRRRGTFHRPGVATRGQREDLIGFELQALVTNPSRTRDLDDIRVLLRAHCGKLDTAEVREHFALLDRTEWLDELLAQVADESS